MSWGEATIFVQERVDSNETADTGLVSNVGQMTLLAHRGARRNDDQYNMIDIDTSDSEDSADGDLLSDLIADVESTNALYPMDTRSETSRYNARTIFRNFCLLFHYNCSLLSGFTAEETRLDSPSISSASGMFSPSSVDRKVRSSQTLGSTKTPAANSSEARGEDQSTEDAEDDWVDVSMDDFDIYDFVKKYGSSP